MRFDRMIGLAALAAATTLTGSAGAQPTAPRTYTVVMASMRFGQMPAAVRRGDIILWVNRDIVPHTATARDRSFDIRVAPHQTARMVVRNAPGNVAVYCTLHPAMRTSMRVAP